MNNSKKKAKKGEISKDSQEFMRFVISVLQTKKGTQAVLKIVLQDIYLMIDRLSRVGNKEWEMLQEKMRKGAIEHGEPFHDEGFCNRQKDDEIRDLFVWELMRVWNLKKKWESENPGKEVKIGG